MKRTVITCPQCGAEYLAQEIYIPEAFFGKASYIEKNEETHKIEEVYGNNSDLDLEESYRCDFCNTPFLVTAKISFIEKEDIDRNFDKDHVTIISAPKIHLAED